MDMHFDRRYLDLVVRWLWLIALASAVAASVSFYFSSQETVKYVAKARLIVGPGVDNPKPNINDLRTSGALMQTYAELALTRPLLERVAASLEPGNEASKLAKQIDVKANTETLILTIQATDKDPVHAVSVANAVADALVGLPQTSMEEIVAGVRHEVTEIESNIEQTKANIERLDRERASAVDVAQQKLYLDQIKEERSSVSEAHKTLATLYESLQQTVTNQVKLVEPAVEASEVPLNTQINVIVAALAGLVLTLLLALLVEFLDTRVKTTDQLAALGTAPVMVAIERHAALAGTGKDRLIVKAQPDAKATDGYRMLNARLLFAKDGQAPRTVMCCGPAAAGEDDSAEAAANLGVILAEAGYRVVLVDANLSRPMVAEILGISARTGLSEALTEKIKNVEAVAVPWAPGLRVVPGGASPEAVRRLASPRMTAIVAELADEADIVIVVAAPVLASAESLAFAPRTDGVLLVARSGRVDRSAMAEAIDLIQAVQARLFGVALTQARRASTASSRRPLAVQPHAAAPAPLMAGGRGERMLPLASRPLAPDQPAT